MTHWLCEAPKAGDDHGILAPRTSRRHAERVIRITSAWVGLCALGFAVACGGSSEDDAKPKKDSGIDGAGASGGFAATGNTGGSGATAGGTSTGGTGTGGSGDGTIDVSSSGLSAAETETNLAIAPDGRMLAVWIGVQPQGGSTNGYSFSLDQGKTWSAPAGLDAPGGRISSDPVAFAAPDGKLYMTFIAFQRSPQGQPFDMRAYLAESAPGSTALSAPIDLTGPVASDSIDKPWGIVTPNGTIYVTWLDTGQPRMRIAVINPTTKAVQINNIDTGQGFRNLIYPCHDAVTGRLYVVYHPGGGIGIRGSDDGGTTWPHVTAVALQSDMPPIFDDPTCVAHDGNVWVSYGIGTDTFDPSANPRSDRIRLAMSTNGAQTFSHVFAEDSSAGTKFLHPQLTRSSDGSLHLLYYAGTNQDPDPQGTVRIATSTDGKTFAPSRIVRSPIRFTKARTDQRWLGDYVGIAAKDLAVFGVFADNNTGTSHVRFFAGK